MVFKLRYKQTTTGNIKHVASRLQVPLHLNTTGSENTATVALVALGSQHYCKLTTQQLEDLHCYKETPLVANNTASGYKTLYALNTTGSARYCK